MAWNFDDNNKTEQKTEAQKQADLERNLKLGGAGAAVFSLASSPGRKVAGAALNVVKGVTAAPLGAGYGLHQSAGAVLRGQGTGGVFGEIFEASRALTAPGDIGGGDTPNISVNSNQVGPNQSGKIIRDRVKSKTSSIRGNVYNSDLAKKAMKNIGKTNTGVTGLASKGDIARQIATDTAKRGGQTVLKFPKVGMLDLAGVFAPFIKMAIDNKKKNIY